MTKTFYGCDVNLSTSLLVDASLNPVVVNCDGQRVVLWMVEMVSGSGTWGSARIDIKRSNNPNGPWFDMATSVQIIATGSTQLTVPVDADTGYLGAVVHTLNGSSMFVNVTVNTKPETLAAV